MALKSQEITFSSRIVLGADGQSSKLEWRLEPLLLLCSTVGSPHVEWASVSIFHQMPNSSNSTLLVLINILVCKANLPSRRITVVCCHGEDIISCPIGPLLHTLRVFPKHLLPTVCKIVPMLETAMCQGVGAPEAHYSSNKILFVPGICSISSCSRTSSSPSVSAL